MPCNNAKVGVSVSFSFFLLFFRGGCRKKSGCSRGGGGIQRKMKGTQGGVQNSYMDYYEFFRTTPGDKYWLIPKRWSVSRCFFGVNEMIHMFSWIRVLIVISIAKQVAIGYLTLSTTFSVDNQETRFPNKSSYYYWQESHFWIQFKKYIYTHELFKENGKCKRRDAILNLIVNSKKYPNNPNTCEKKDNISFDLVPLR